MVTTQVHGETLPDAGYVNAVQKTVIRLPAHYHKAKAFADRHLIETNLDWTIVCPGNLRDEGEWFNFRLPF